MCGKRCTDTSTIAACPKITDDERKELFDSYWRMNWDQRRIYIGSMVTSRIPNGNPERLKKSCILKYNFRVNGVLIPVCKKFFLQTLGMGEWSVSKWSSTTAATNITTPVQKLNLQNRSHDNKDLYASAKQFLDSLPKLPSHYSRAESNKEYCTENDQPLASRTILRSVFKDMNVSLFSPKKDQCDTCASHKAGNVTEEEFAAHLRRKEEACDEKKIKVEMCSREHDTVLIFADLQKVLLSPSQNASATYYKTKLCCYNYTIYDKTHEAMCYM